jgi:hypothetical protein
MTTNFAEVYNWVMRGVRGLPLTGIVEFLIYNLNGYFRKRFSEAEVAVNNQHLVFGKNITDYMKKKMEKAKQHDVVVMGTQERRYEVVCKGRVRCAMRMERVVRECVIRTDGTCICSCQKPRCFHLPCSHVLAAVAMCNSDPNIYVSPYYLKGTIQSTWAFEVYRIATFGTFTATRNPPMYIPDPRTMRVKKGRRKTRRIRNDMDVSEAGRKVRCSKCNEEGHTYKKCDKEVDMSQLSLLPLTGGGDGRMPADGDGSQATASTSGSGRRRRQSRAMSSTMI